MTNENIILFAKDFLRSEPTVTEWSLQRFLLERDEVGIALPLDELRAGLDEGYKNGVFEIVVATDEVGVYRLVGGTK